MGYAQLVMTKGPRLGQTFPLDQPVLTLGRDPRHELVVDHPQVSRRHARVVRQKDVWVLQDLDSTNGTLVNGTWLTGPHALAAGDEIGLGEAVLLVYQEEGTGERDTAPAQPAKASPPPPPGRTKPPDRRDFSVGPVPKPPRRGSPMRGAAAEPRPDRTGLWLGIGCFVLLLIVACTSVLLLDTLGLLPSLLYEPLRWLGLM